MSESSMNGRDVEILKLQDLDATPVAVQIPVQKGPISGIAASLDGSRLMVTNYGGDSVSIIDTDACRVVDTIDDVAEPFAIALGNGDRAYVSTVSAAYDAIQVVDLATGTVVTAYPLALSVSDLAVSADGQRLYASRNGVRGADVVVLDATTDQIKLIDAIDIATAAGTTAECVRVSPKGDRLYVGVNGPSGGQLIVVDTGTAAAESESGRSRWGRKNTKSAATSRANAKTKSRSKGGRKGAKPGLTVLGIIEIGLAVRDVAVSPNGSLVYVASSGPDFAAIDVVEARTHKITSTRKIAEVSGLLTRLTLSADGDRAYLVSDDSVTTLCTLTQDVIDSVDVANQPSCVVESRDGKHLYIADYSGAVTVAPLALGAEIEPIALESKQSVDLFVPDLLQYDAALV